MGHSTTYTYDANHNLIAVTDPLGHVATYTYDANGGQTSKTYPRTPTSVNTTSYTAYNAYRERISITNELQRAGQFA